MEESKIIAALFSFLSVVFWKWVSSIDAKLSKLEEKQENSKEEFKNYVSKDDFFREMKEVKTLMKELQKDINRIRFEDRRGNNEN